ncbi:unnamed protein product [Dibothriocephalus latus]|uniref:Choline O-acetyltransferase n=1 Tax=Dibothriocephalus latus TaxID=60516 RepID=A0A3P7MHZ9_DIBLA|nr:unnamed protein product [Dibothriocephalus latus]
MKREFEVVQVGLIMSDTEGITVTFTFVSGLQTDDCIRLLRAAMDWQTEVMLETILGHGVDNHLLGLREIALQLGRPMPNIFKDQTYAKSNWFRLGTSQVRERLNDHSFP